MISSSRIPVAVQQPPAAHLATIRDAFCSRSGVVVRADRERRRGQRRGEEES